MDIDISEKWLPVYEALASNVRLAIINQLSIQPMNVKELAQSQGLSSAIMTMHVKKLEKAGIIRTEMTPGKGGVQKTCYLNVDNIHISFPKNGEQKRSFHQLSIPVGHYSDFDIHPTCGLATTEKFIGLVDDPRYFSDPEKMGAGILWLGHGYVEYKFPNYLLRSETPTEIEISFELSSEAPLTNNNWPSDITFYINGVNVGIWTSPGDFGDQRGKYTPEWWPEVINQYGLLKLLRVNQNGTFMDGEKISDVTLNDIVLNEQHWTLRLAVEEDAKHVGGLTIFGSGFGNYDQDILFRVYYV